MNALLIRRAIAMLNAIPLNTEDKPKWWASPQHVFEALKAAHMGVDIRTVQRDLHALADAGMIERRPGEGVFYGRTKTLEEIGA